MGRSANRFLNVKNAPCFCVFYWQKTFSLPVVTSMLQCQILSLGRFIKGEGGRCGGGGDQGMSGGGGFGFAASRFGRLRQKLRGRFSVSLPEIKTFNNATRTTKEQQTGTTHRWQTEYRKGFFFPLPKWLKVKPGSNRLRDRPAQTQNLPKSPGICSEWKSLRSHSNQRERL